jgi:hypothetical protein
MKLFDEFELNTPLDDHINSLIMSQADDIAEKLTELECRLNGIQCYFVEMVSNKNTDGEVEERSYTSEAQDIFNVYYDEQVTALYSLLNEQLKVIKEIK